MGQVLAFQLDDALRDVLLADLARSGDHLEAVTPHDGLLRLERADASVDAVVVGTDVQEPVRTAQRIFVLAPRVPVVILTEPERHQAVFAALQVAPFVSEELRCLGAAAPERLVTEVREVIDRRRRAQSFQRTADALNARLAASPSPESSPAVLGGILDNAPIGVVVTDPEGKVVAWNKSASENLARSEKSALGMRLEELFEPDERERFRRLFQPLLERTHGAVVRETLRRLRDGGIQHLEVTGAALGGQRGRAPLLFIFQDVTDRVELLEQLREAVRLRDDFLSIASHELKTPLTPLQLQVQSLRRQELRGEPLPARVLTKLDVIERQVNRLDKLVSSLLDVARLTGKRLELDLEEVDLAALMQELATRFEAEATAREAPLVVDAPRAVIGRWDRLRLEQILSNLIVNALKFGAGRPVVLGVEAEGGRARAYVRDQGIGISAADQRRIFERFERAVPDREYGGFGLGLWISSQLAKALGGTLEVESEPGHGATFTLTLPLPQDS